MQEFNDYDINIPDLVYDILDYFRVNNNVRAPKDKSIIDFCDSYKNNNTPATNGRMVQPPVVHKICENLVKKGELNRIRTGIAAGGIDANYLYLPGNDAVFLMKHPIVLFRHNCMAYGFPYIYAKYKNIVLPVIVKTSDDRITMGTCFRFNMGILTAKHCLDAKEVWIMGYTADQLKQCPVYISKNKDLDMAYIDLGEQAPIIHEEANVLDEVLAMGYPKIPMFSDFCTAERAVVSSISTKGAVASIADQYMSPGSGPLMLVTARIRGGNSGGPIINSNGAVVGLAFAEPLSKGDYDDMGYGIAYPISVYFQMLKQCTTMQVNFVDEVQ